MNTLAAEAKKKKEILVLLCPPPVVDRDLHGVEGDGDADCFKEILTPRAWTEHLWANKV